MGEAFVDVPYSCFVFKYQSGNTLMMVLRGRVRSIDGDAAQSRSAISLLFLGRHHGHSAYGLRLRRKGRLRPW